MGFLDPDGMTSEWFQRESKLYELEQKVDEELIKFKEDAIKRCHIVSANFPKEIAATIAFGYREGFSEAVDIVNYLFLNEKHIAALTDNHDEMKKIVKKEDEEEQDWFDSYIQEQYYA